MKLTQEYLKSVLDYDPETGVFTWKTRHISTFKSNSQQYCDIWNGRYANTIAGRSDNRGYRGIMINKRRYLSHRLAYLYMTGDMPVYQIDHINRVRSDNSWGNLRSVTHEENARNQPLRIDNTSGHTGICWHKRAGKWAVEVCEKHVGLYADLSDAIAAAISKRNELGFHPNHGQELPPWPHREAA
jgi:hypothetical protein